MKIIKKNFILISIFFILVIVLIIIFLQNKLNKEKYYNITIDNITREEENSEIEEPEEIFCMVDIKGAIKMPGVYQSNCNKYVSDIIALAGGLTENADTTYINLAKKIADEMVIVIYTKEEIDNLTKVSDTTFECVCPEIINDACLNDNSSNDTSNSKLININTASISELMTINGIGEARAKAIIEYRKKNGKFKKIDDILNVSGIGAVLYEQIKAYITT